jgi:hypothetical protein
VDIANNTILWDPPVRVPAFQSTADFTGTLPNRFTENTVVAVSRSFVSSQSSIQYSGNRYCAPKRLSSDSLLREELSVDSVSAASPLPVESDPAANKPDELCGCLGELLQRTLGTGLRSSASGVSIKQPGHWVLGALLAPPGEPAAHESRSHLALIESMMHQFASLGLKSIVVPAYPMGKEELEQWRTDWNFDPTVEIDAANARGLRNAGSAGTATLLLVSPSGQVAASWQYPVSPADVWLQIQSHLGTPAGAQQIPACQNWTAK